VSTVLTGLANISSSKPAKSMLILYCKYYSLLLGYIVE